MSRKGCVLSIGSYSFDCIPGKWQTNRRMSPAVGGLCKHFWTQINIFKTCIFCADPFSNTEKKIEAIVAVAVWATPKKSTTGEWKIVCTIFLNWENPSSHSCQTVDAKIEWKRISSIYFSIMCLPARKCARHIVRNNNKNRPGIMYVAFCYSRCTQTKVRWKIAFGRVFLNIDYQSAWQIFVRLRCCSCKRAKEQEQIAWVLFFCFYLIAHALFVRCESDICAGQQNYRHVRPHTSALLCCTFAIHSLFVCYNFGLARWKDQVKSTWSCTGTELRHPRNVIPVLSDCIDCWQAEVNICLLLTRTHLVRRCGVANSCL